MKSIYLFLLCLLWSFTTVGQELKQDLSEFEVSPPKFMLDSTKIGDIHEYIAKNFQYPSNQQGLCLGTSIISFTVKSDKSLKNFEVVNSVSNAIDDEIIRILKNTQGHWVPGSNNGKPVDMKMEFVIMVKTGMSDEMAARYDFDEMAEQAFSHGNELLFKDKKPRKALRHLNKGIRLLPRDQNLLFVRGLCYSQLGKDGEALEDWERMRELGGSAVNGSVWVLDQETDKKEK